MDPITSERNAPTWWIAFLWVEWCMGELVLFEMGICLDRCIYEAQDFCAIFTFLVYFGKALLQSTCLSIHLYVNNPATHVWAARWSLWNVPPLLLTIERRETVKPKQQLIKHIVTYYLWPSPQLVLEAESGDRNICPSHLLCCVPECEWPAMHAVVPVWECLLFYYDFLCFYVLELQTPPGAESWICWSPGFWAGMKPSVFCGN